MPELQGARRVAAAVCLPAALASVLIGVVPGPGAAAPPPGLRAQIEEAARSRSIMLELENGQAVSGEFYGFLGDWGDTVDASVRYEKWRNAHPEGVPRLGERMVVVRSSGDTLRGTFEGVGPTYLALGGGNSRFVNMTPFDVITDARSEDTGSVTSWTDLHRRLLDAPLLIGVGLKRGADVVIVPREAIFAVRGSGGRSAGSTGFPIVVFGIAAGVLLLAICAGSSGGSSGTTTSGDWGGLWRTLTSCSKADASAMRADRVFGDSDVSSGLRPWAPDDTRRP